ncbi:MAG: aminomethyl-transferring glycine dehydrogenase subunit GcvPA [Caldisericota bacterium]|nr:aminomethyl-transferring glycine dehydrogenase subunit GcvPA [Caldisericota bacterium]
MKYIPNTDNEKKGMLKEIGVSSFNELIKDIPENIRLKRALSIPGPFDEEKIKEQVHLVAEKNVNFFSFKHLIGAGAYRHYIPEVVKAIVSREEFYTSYTPYQPEISQGNLQSMFELQTHLARLTGMNVVVPSLYDGASAVAEAVLMAVRITHKNRIIVSSLVHPHYREVIATYTKPHDIEIIELPFDKGCTDFFNLKNLLKGNTAAVVVQSPNFFGGIENIATIASEIHDTGALLIHSIAESISLGLLTAPADMGVDIVAGESQSFGMDLNFGGPYNGYLATKTRFLRQLPGRIAGETVDKNGKRAFVMTMRAREQDIKREKATSNICSNHALNIVAANVYLSLLGKNGLYQVALLNTKAAHYLKRKLTETNNFEIFEYPFFNEFVVKSKIDIDELKNRLFRKSFVPPLRVDKFYKKCENYLLFTVTEILKREELDRIAEMLGVSH